jgi:alpha-beta hydrolase superfamily lysophospholipase
VPALLRFVLHEAKAPQAHFLGHSMGGMVLCGVMARNDAAAARIRSCIAVGSGLFLEGRRCVALRCVRSGESCDEAL